jgi:hypothetical protein
MVVDDGYAGVVNGLLVLSSEVWAGSSQVLMLRRARGGKVGLPRVQAAPCTLTRSGGRW